MSNNLLNGKEQWQWEAELEASYFPVKELPEPKKTLDRRATEAYNHSRQMALLMLCKGYREV